MCKTTFRLLSELAGMLSFRDLRLRTGVQSHCQGNDFRLNKPVVPRHQLTVAKKKTNQKQSTRFSSEVYCYFIIQHSS